MKFGGRGFLGEMGERWKIAGKTVPQDRCVIFIFEKKSIICYRDVRYRMFDYKKDKYRA